MPLDNYFDINIYLRNFKFIDHSKVIPIKLKISFFYKFDDKIDKNIIESLFYYYLLNNNNEVFSYKILIFNKEKNIWEINFNEYYLTKLITFNKKCDKEQLNENIKFKFIWPNKLKYFNNKLFLKIDLITNVKNINNINNSDNLERIGNQMINIETKIIPLMNIINFNVEYQKIIFDKIGFNSLDFLIVNSLNYCKFNQIENINPNLKNKKLIKLLEYKNLNKMLINEEYKNNDNLIDKFYKNYIKNLKSNIDNLFIYLNFKLNNNLESESQKKLNNNLNKIINFYSNYFLENLNIKRLTNNKINKYIFNYLENYKINVSNLKDNEKLIFYVLFMINNTKFSELIKDNLVNIVEIINHFNEFLINLKYILQIYLLKNLNYVFKDKIIEFKKKEKIFLKDNFYKINKIKDLNSISDRNFYKNIYIKNNYNNYPLFYVENFNTIKTTKLFFKNGVNIFILSHGYNGHSNDMYYYKMYLLYYLKNVIIFNLKSNENKFDTNIEELSNNLYIEINELFLKLNKNHIKIKSINFIGFSLGGLLLRRLVNLLKDYKIYFKNFISLGTPHLGIIDSENIILNTGINIYSKLTNDQIIKELKFQDNNDIYKTILYILSIEKCFEYFENVFWVSSPQDYFTPFYSSKIELSNKFNNNMFYKSLINNIFNKNIKNLFKININILENKNNLDYILGRNAHIELISNKNLVKLLIKYLKNYF